MHTCIPKLHDVTFQKTFISVNTSMLLGLISMFCDDSTVCMAIVRNSADDILSTAEYRVTTTVKILVVRVALLTRRSDVPYCHYYTNCLSCLFTIPTFHFTSNKSVVSGASVTNTTTIVTLLLLRSPFFLFPLSLFFHLLLFVPFPFLNIP